MIASLVVIALIASGLVLACTSSAPTTDRSRQRSANRRRAYVNAHPQSVTSADILAHLRRDGVAPDKARFIVDRAAEHRISAFTMWLWLQKFDAEALALVVAADLTSKQLVEHICNGTVPNLAELRVFAAINGLELTGPLVAPRRPAGPVRHVLTRTRSMPEIFAPGILPDGRSLAQPIDRGPDTERGSRSGLAA